MTSASKSFAFYGRVSTEDQQDPEASRSWQLARAVALTEKHGPVVAEFFDIGQSRSIPWKRRPEAETLLGRLKDPDRGFDAVVLGEPQRAFYGNQYGLTFPVFTHYDVQLWVPEVGGPIDPESEAHDLVMSVFGGMSKGERSRIKVRVRSAMSSQAKIEGRFLGGRPPYGYRLAEAGVHPHPAKAAEGKRLHRLEPDPVAAPIVGRIFAECIAGRGLYAIAEGLTSDGIASPSAHDPDRNRHRDGTAWSKGAVRAILANPRYTGRQVWNKQRKDEVLIDVEDVALGHETKMRWNDPKDWIWSDEPAHEPLVDADTFTCAREIAAAHGAAHKSRTRQSTRHAYALRGVLYCGPCERRMQGQHSKGRLYYRCRYPYEYALANKVPHPRNVYLAEQRVLGPLDDWLATSFRPGRLSETIDAMFDAQVDIDQDPDAARAALVIEECDRKLAPYREALDTGTDPKIVGRWITETQATRTAAVAKTRKARGRTRMSKEEITELVETLGNIGDALAAADPADKAEVYKQLGLRLTYEPGNQVVRAEARFSPGKLGLKSVSEGGPERNPHPGVPD